MYSSTICWVETPPAETITFGKWIHHQQDGSRPSRELFDFDSNLGDFDLQSAWDVFLADTLLRPNNPEKIAAIYISS